MHFWLGEPDGRASREALALSPGAGSLPAPGGGSGNPCHGDPGRSARRARVSPEQLLMKEPVGLRTRGVKEAEGEPAVRSGGLAQHERPRTLRTAHAAAADEGRCVQRPAPRLSPRGRRSPRDNPGPLAGRFLSCLFHLKQTMRLFGTLGTGGHVCVCGRACAHTLVGRVGRGVTRHIP